MDEINSLKVEVFDILARKQEMENEYKELEKKRVQLLKKIKELKKGEDA